MRVKLWNQAIWGWTSVDVQNYELPVVCNPTSNFLVPPCPKIVTITAGANDFDFANLRRWLLLHPTSTSRRKYANRLAKTLYDNLGRVIDETRQVSPRGEIFVTNYYNSSDRRICRLAFKIGEDLLWAGKRTGLNEVIKRVAEEKGVHFVDIYTSFLKHGAKSPDGSWLFSRDCNVATLLHEVPKFASFDPHPNGFGQQAIAEAIWKETAPYLR